MKQKEKKHWKKVKEQQQQSCENDYIGYEWLYYLLITTYYYELLLQEGNKTTTTTT